MVTYQQCIADFPTECPWCKSGIDPPDMCDVGVGFVQCGPQHCNFCLASEIGPYDEDRPLSVEERKLGWYKPNSIPGRSANTFHGEIIDHKYAQDLYRAGLKINDHHS